MKQRRLINQINVVPYIDVMLVLMVIFMITAPLIQTSSVDLPSVAKSAQPPAAPIEVIVKADRSLYVRDQASGSQEIPVTMAALRERVARAQARNPEQKAVIAGDRSVPYGAVMDVLDQLQQTNGVKVSLLVQPPK